MSEIFSRRTSLQIRSFCVVATVFICGMLLIGQFTALLSIANATGLNPVASVSEAPEPDKAPPPSVAEDIQSSAPVIVDGETVFVVRGMSALPAEERATQIADNIVSAAENPSVSSDWLELIVEEDRHGIYVGDQLIVEIFEADAEIESVDRSVLAEANMNAIGEAIDNYRQDRTSKDLLRNLMVAAVGTALFLLLIVVMRWVGRKMRAIFETRYKMRLEEVEEKSFRLLQAEQLWSLLVFLQRMVAFLILVVAFYVYVNSVLSLFPWTRAIGTTLLELILSPLKVMGQGLIDVIPDLVFLVILFYIVRFLLKAMQNLFSAISRESITFKGFDKDWAWPTHRIVRLVVLLFALVVAYPYIPGSESNAFKALTLFVGVLLSLGSSSFIANIIAGYMLTYRRAFKVGDIIQIGEVTGEVVETRVLETHIRTWQNEEVILPNSEIINGQVTNYSVRAKHEGLVLQTTVGIGYEVPWRQVEAMLLMAAKRTKGITHDREPFVRQQSLGDFGVNYQINVYCSTPEKMPELYTNLHRNIQDVFNENGVSIMTPTYVGDPAEPKYVPKERWYEAPAAPGPDAGEK